MVFLEMENDGSAVNASGILLHRLFQLNE